MFHNFFFPLFILLLTLFNSFSGMYEYESMYLFLSKAFQHFCFFFLSHFILSWASLIYTQKQITVSLSLIDLNESKWNKYARFPHFSVTPELLSAIQYCFVCNCLYIAKRNYFDCIAVNAKLHITKATKSLNTINVTKIQVCYSMEISDIVKENIAWVYSSFNKSLKCRNHQRLNVFREET